MPRVRVPRYVAQLVVDYFAYAARPGASARRVTRHAARRRLLRLHRVSGCLSMLLGSSRGSSSTILPHAGSLLTTSPVSCTWMRRLAALLLIGRLHWLSPCAPSLCLPARLLRARTPRFRLAVALALLQPHRVSQLLVSRQHRLYFEYVVRRHDIVFRSHRVYHSSRLVFQTSRERQSHPQQIIGINSD
jgi:hypothetical protein